MRHAATTACLLLGVIGSAAAQDYKIAFVSARKPERGVYLEHGVYTMNADGSGVKRLTVDEHALLMDGAWSPDGGRILFSAMRRTGMHLGVHGLVWTAGDETILSKYNLPFHFPLYVMDADGANQKRLLDMPAVPGAMWSPDGKRILFASAYEDPKRNDPAVANGRKPVSSALYVLDLATRQIKRITPVGASDLSPFASWSPDGSRVVYVCGTSPQPREICTVSADGTGERRLTTRNAINVMPDWSADGGRIAFVAAPHGQSDEGAGVFVMDATGENLKRVSKLRTSSVLWSPDGKNLLMRTSGGTYLVSVEQNVATKPSLGEGRILDELFSPDGRQIIYRSNSEGGRWKIYAWSIDGGTRRRLSDDTSSDSMFAVSHFHNASSSGALK